MAEALVEARCKSCGRKAFDHDGRGRIEYECKRCGVLNTVQPRAPLPPLARLGTLPPRTK
jgi:phage FluMu protein Com